MKNEHEGETKPIEICFGMVTEFCFEGKTSKHVVIKLGEDDWLETSKIINTDGEQVLVSPGTASRRDITHVTNERWTKEQILEAFKGFYASAGIPDSLTRILDTESQRSPRILA